MSPPPGVGDPESRPGPGRAPPGPLPLECGPAGPAIHRRPRWPQYGCWPQVQAQPATAKPRILLSSVPEPPQRRRRVGAVAELQSLLLPGQDLKMGGWRGVGLEGSDLTCCCVCPAVVLAGVPDGEDRAEPGDKL